MNKWGIDQFFIAKYAIIKRLKFALLCWWMLHCIGGWIAMQPRFFDADYADFARIYADYFLWIRECLKFQPVGHKWPARFFLTQITQMMSVDLHRFLREIH